MHKLMMRAIRYGRTVIMKSFALKTLNGKKWLIGAMNVNIRPLQMYKVYKASYKCKFYYSTY